MSSPSNMNTGHNSVLQLSPGLLVRIFSKLDGDPGTLRSCAFTCRAWLEPSRRLLHESVRIEPSPQYLHHLSQIYISSNLAQYVHALTITLAGWPQTDAQVLHDNQDLLISLFRGFTHLQRLNLQNLVWSSLPPETIHLVLGLTGLQSLTLRSVSFDSNVQFESTILAFPNLSTLSIDDVQWSEDLPFPPMDPEKDMSLPLQSLRLGTCTSQAALAERLLCYNFDLRKFELKWEDFRRTKPIRDLLRSAGSHLRELSIDLPQIVCAQNADEVEHLESDFNLSYNTNLRSIHFHSIFLDAHPTEAFHVSWVYGPLAQASNDTLSQVTFDVFADGVPSLSRFQWDCVSRLLSAERFRNAPNVVVNAHIMVDEEKDQGKTTNESVVKYLKGHLALLQERVTVHPDIVG